MCMSIPITSVLFYSLTLTLESIKTLGRQFDFIQCNVFGVAMFGIVTRHDFATLIFLILSQILSFAILFRLMEKHFDGDGWNFAAMNDFNVCTTFSEICKFWFALETNKWRHFAAVFFFSISHKIFNFFDLIDFSEMNWFSCLEGVKLSQSELNEIKLELLQEKMIWTIDKSFY